MTPRSFGVIWARSKHDLNLIWADQGTSLPGPGKDFFVRKNPTHQPIVRSKTTSNRQHTTDDKQQQTTNNKQQATNNRQQTTDNRQHSSSSPSSLSSSPSLWFLRVRKNKAPLLRSAVRELSARRRGARKISTPRIGRAICLRRFHKVSD